MKRIVSYVLAIVMLFGVCPAMNGAVSAQNDSYETITVDIPDLNSRGYIDKNNFQIEVSLMHSADKTKYYNVKCEIGGKQYNTAQIVARPGVSVTKTIDITNCRQGPVSIRVDVYENTRVVKSYTADTTVIIPYQKQFLEKYSNKGINGAAPAYQDYFDLMGLQNSRLGDEWYWIENQQQGVYNWPVHYQQQFDAGQNPLYLAVYGNPLYSGESADKKGPTTKIEIDAYTKYMLEVIRKYPSIKYVELWNEPNISFWLPTPNLTDYMNLVKVSSMALRKEKENLIIAGGSIAVNDYKWINSMYENNAFAYLDSLSVHPYGYPAGTDEFLQNILTNFDENAFKHGGWYENTSTEFGWPTHIGNRGISAEQQAIEAAKHYIVTDYNDFTINQFYRMNDLAISGTHDDTYNEDNFGIIRYDGTPKPAVPAIAQVCKETNGAQQVGKLEAPAGIEAYIYVKNKEPLVVMWKSTAAPAECPDSFTFDEKVTVYDMYGNRLTQANTVNLGEEPVYIKGVTADTAAKSLSYTIQCKLDEKLKFLQEASKKEGYKEMKDILYQGVEMTKLSHMPSEQEIEELFDRYYTDVLTKLADEYKKGTFKGSLMDLTSMLYAAHLGGVRIMNLAMVSVAQNEQVNTDNARLALEKADREIKEKMGAGTLSYACAIKKFAQEYYEKIQEVTSSNEQNVMRAGVLKMWAKMVEKLSALAGEVAQAEPVAHDNILLLMPSVQAQFDIGTRKTSNMLVYNYSSEAISGTIEIADPSGEIVGKSEAVTILPDESAEIGVDILLDRLYGENEQYMMRFNTGSEYLVNEAAPINVRTKIDVNMGLIETNFKGIKNVTVKIKNLIDEPVKGKIKITAPDGWTMQTEVQDFSVNQESEIPVAFPVVKKTAAAYHYYPFKIEISDNKERVLYDNYLPLSFSVVPKTDTEYDLQAFDGNISSWADAYPIYLGLPKDVTSYEDWKLSDIAARVLTKWDQNYLYLLVDAFDNVHSQLKRGADIWNGDCVQVSIDPNNDKDDAKYETEDYEYGFAYTDQGGNVAYSWYKGSGKPGEEPNTYSTMLRENSTRLSRYLIKLPAEAISPMKLAEGSAFGYNVVLNDADFTEREKFIEYVPGTGAEKKPSIYPTYRLISKEDMPAGMSSCPIPSTMVASEKVSEDNSAQQNMYFDDIKNHWASETIIQFAEEGLVSGTGDNKFEPDRPITRAEFATLIMNTAGIKESGSAYFADVGESDWFYKAANAVNEEGLLFDEMLENGFCASQYITREEAVGMAGRYYLVKGKAGGRKPLDQFNDSGLVSSWARTALEVACHAGILNGDDLGNINPQGTITRAEAVTVLKKFIKK